ncbi:MAG TPA: efflux RND transporter permease subunit [Chthonomonadaceae bacterium]|nr:efflux RND transporter permease subunit [Chthonomonadaceae bacterium]
MKLSRFATGHLKAILFTTIALCAIGAWMIGSFPVSILPDVSFPRVMVIAESGDRPVRMMQATITRPLEQAIATIAGVSHIRSKTQRGATEISIDFYWGTDIPAALQLVNARMNQVRQQLPPGTEVSAERMNPTVFPILGLSLRSKSLAQDQLWSLATYTLLPRLTRVPGVARVEIQGGRVPEIEVTADPARLAAFKLSLQDVEQAISQTNQVRSVGRLDRRFQQYQALVTGDTSDPDRLKRLVVATRGGIPITLDEVATIQRGVQDQTTIVTADGAEAVLLNIVRQPDANTVVVSEAVRRELAAMEPTLPAGTRIAPFYDQSALIGEAITSVRDAVLIGAGLAVVVLLLFLGNLRATAVTAIIIPATVLITFLLMRLSGLTLNLMTLGALAVGTGLVIDDAIVVVENVFRHLAHGASSADAVAAAANEIAAPMISSTVTTVVVFLPLMLVSGIVGAFFTALAVTLTIALMVSLALALLVSPSLCATFLKVRAGASEHGRLFQRFLELYESVLRFSLRYWWATAAAVAAVVGLTVFFGSHLQVGFMPEMDEGAFVLDYLTPPGTSLQESNRLLNKVEDMLRETPEVESYSRRTGTELGFAITEPNRGDFAVTLKKRRHRSIDAVMDDLRDRIQKEAPGLDVDFHQVLMDLIHDLSGAPSPIEIKLFGSDEAQLEAAADKLKERIAKVKGIADTKTSAIEAGPELVARVDPQRAGRLGLTTDSIATQVDAAMFGDVATQILEDDRQIGVRVRMPAGVRSDRSQFALLPIRTPAGVTTPLSSVADIQDVPGTTEENRDDQRRMVAVTGEISGRDLGSIRVDVEKIMRSAPLPAGVTYVLGGEFHSQSESFQNMGLVLALAILLVFAVMLFQFGDFTTPVVILLIMPLSLFGVTFGLWATKTALNVSSFMGAIMLAGIVVKNGILLLDQAHQAERTGSPVDEAIVQAGRIRLRPILMTTLTAILGLAPLALGIGAGAEMQKPLAIAVIGGLSFSTVFTLVFAPALYLAFRRLAARTAQGEQWS